MSAVKFFHKAGDAVEGLGVAQRGKKRGQFNVWLMLCQPPGAVSDNAKRATPRLLRSSNFLEWFPIVRVKEQTVGTVPSSPASLASRRWSTCRRSLPDCTMAIPLQVDGWRGRVVKLAARSTPNAELPCIRSNYCSFSRHLIRR